MRGLFKEKTQVFFEMKVSVSELNASTAILYPYAVISKADDPEAKGKRDSKKEAEAEKQADELLAAASSLSRRLGVESGKPKAKAKPKNKSKKAVKVPKGPAAEAQKKALQETRLFFTAPTIELHRTLLSQQSSYHRGSLQELAS